jgi:hypothetical protein
MKDKRSRIENRKQAFKDYINGRNKWYKLLGAFLVGFGSLNAVLFLVRFTLLRSIGFVHFFDDFLTMGISNIFLFPCGLWLFSIGSHPDKYAKVNRLPLAFISISPAAIVITSLVFLVNDFTPFPITIKSLSEPASLLLYFSLIFLHGFLCHRQCAFTVPGYQK